MSMWKKIFGSRTPSSTAGPQPESSSSPQSKSKKTRPISILEVHLPVSKPTIASGASGYNDVKTKLDDVVRLAMAGDRRPLINLTLSGYDADPRELHEIPEVCQWARGLRDAVPALFYFLAPASQQRYVGWICGPVKPSAVNTPEFRSKFEECWAHCAAYTMAADPYLKALGASESYIASLIATDFKRLG